jgi:hypothetical protein
MTSLFTDTKLRKSVLLILEIHTFQKLLNIFKFISDIDLAVVGESIHQC